MDLGAKSLWFDEGTSIAIAGLDWHGLWQESTVYGEANMSLYHVLLHLWLALGQSESAIRGFSVLLAVMTVPVFYLLAARLFDRGVAVVAGTLLVLNAFFVHYAQEARGYSLVLFLVTCSSYLFVRALDRPTWRSWLIYAAVSALSLYAHFFAGLVLLAHVLSLSVPRGPTQIGKLVAAYGLVALAGLPLLLFIFTGDRGQISWIPPLSFVSIGAVFRSLTGDGGWPLLLAYFVACLVALLSVVQARRTQRTLSWPHIFAAFCLFVPVGVSLAVSLVKSLFLDRYLIVALPGLVLTAAVGISSLRIRWVRTAVLVITLALASQGLLGWYAHYEKEDWRDAAAYVLKDSEPGDAIVFYRPRARNAFAYYVERFQSGADVTPIYPSAPWGTYLPLPLAQAEMPSALRAVRRYSRIWVVLRPAALDTRSPEVELLLDSLAQHRETSRRSFVGIEVRLYGAPDDAAARATFQSGMSPLSVGLGTAWSPRAQQ
jgi:mannosyltransferase